MPGRGAGPRPCVSGLSLARPLIRGRWRRFPPSRTTRPIRVSGVARSRLFCTRSAPALFCRRVPVWSQVNRYPRDPDLLPPRQPAPARPRPEGRGNRGQSQQSASRGRKPVACDRWAAVLRPTPRDARPALPVLARGRTSVWCLAAPPTAWQGGNARHAGAHSQSRSAQWSMLREAEPLAAGARPRGSPARPPAERSPPARSVAWISAPAFQGGQAHPASGEGAPSTE